MRKMTAAKSRCLNGGAIPWGFIIDTATSLIPVFVNWFKG